jgi:phage pi2 protein 07
VQPSYNKPVQGSISLSIPNDGVVTVTDVYQFLQDLVATFWWDGQLRLEKELRGSTNPLSD